MKKLKKIALWTLAVALAGGAAFLVPTIWLKPWSIDHFYARTFLVFALRHPMLLSGMRILEPMGLDFHNDDLDDNSLEFQREEAGWTARQLQILRSYDRDDLDDPLSYDVLEWFLADSAAASRFLFHDYPVNQLSGVQSTLPDFMLNTHQIDDAGDAKKYIARLSRFDDFFDDTVAGLVHRRELGVVPPRFVLDRVLAEMRSFIADPPRDNPLFVHLAERLGEIESSGDQADLLRRAEDELASSVIPAYERLIDAVVQLQEATTDDDGVWKLPDGEAFYAHRLRHYTTTEMSAGEIHRLGLAEVDRIQIEMRAILAAEGREAESVGAAMAALAEDPEFLFPDTDAGREQILSTFTALIEEVEAGLGPMFAETPRAAVTVERIPEFKQETAPVAYYDSPPFDGSKPGTFYVNLRHVGEHARFGLRTLAYHEAIPGHHFQIALAQEMEGVPFFRRIIPFTAYVEGWALYAESLAAESGFQENPYDRLGYLQSQLFRAVRLVVDTGIHAERWTREAAIDYMRTLTGMAESEVTAEIERYIVDPGQACAYKVGQLKILALRRRASEQLGEAFDLREFHAVVLGEGALPLTVLEGLVDDWIASKTRL